MVMILITLVEEREARLLRTKRLYVFMDVINVFI